MTTGLKLPDYERLGRMSPAECARRAAERRGRSARNARAAEAETRVPRFARRLSLIAPVSIDLVAMDVAAARGLDAADLRRPLTGEGLRARAEAIYWAFGLTQSTAAAIGGWFDLDGGADGARTAMRAHARSSGLPAILIEGEDE